MAFERTDVKLRSTLLTLNSWLSGHIGSVQAAERDAHSSSCTFLLISSHTDW